MTTARSEARQTYEQEGYHFEPGLIPAGAMAAVRTRVMEIIEDNPSWGKQSFQCFDPAFKTNREGRPYPGGIQLPAQHEEVFAAVANHPNLVAAMGELLGGEVERFTDQVGVKHGFLDNEQGGCSFYHQDSWYWKLEPELGCNCWIPMDEVGPGAIALGVKPRTHLDGTLHPHEQYFDDPSIGHTGAEGFQPFKRHRIPLDEVDFSDEIVFPMQPGDGLFFTNYTWHRSEPNRTGETRMFYAIAHKRIES